MHLSLNTERNKSYNFKNTDDFIKDLKTFINNFNNNPLNNNIYYSIDRFTENFAICENKESSEIINIPKILIDKNAKPGDIIKLKNNRFIVDKEKTNIEQEEVKNLVNSLFKKRNSK